MDELRNVVQAVVRLANAWRRSGGPDQGFEDFIREAASVSGAPDATLVLPHLESGTDADPSSQNRQERDMDEYKAIAERCAQAINELSTVLADMVARADAPSEWRDRVLRIAGRLADGIEEGT